MGNYNRKCMAIHAKKSLKGIDFMETITLGPVVLPKRVKVDNECQFISKVLDKLAYENKVEKDYQDTEKPTNNRFIKNFNSSYSNKYLTKNQFFSLMVA